MLSRPGPTFISDCIRSVGPAGDNRTTRQYHGQCGPIRLLKPNRDRKPYAHGPVVQGRKGDRQRDEFVSDLCQRHGRRRWDVHGDRFERLQRQSLHPYNDAGGTDSDRGSGHHY